MKKFTRPFLVATLAVLAPLPAFAYGARTYYAPTVDPLGVGVPVSGSIAMPGSATAVYTNPAGLIGNAGVRLSLQGASDHPMDNPSYRGLLLAGNGMFAAAGGVKYQINGGSSNDVGYGVYGLAVNISPLDLTLGVAGQTGIKNAKGTDTNAGFLFHPTSLVTIGGTAMGVNHTVDSYGLGVALELVSGFDLVADSAFDNKFKNGEFKPGIKLANSFAGISVSYGTGATPQFAKDASGAVYLRVAANSEFEFEYNHGGDLPKYFASLSFGF
jgi:hypothetical protein